MENNAKNPVPLFALAMTVFIAGSFLLVVQIGTNGRKADGLHFAYSYKGVEAAAAAYAGDFKRGTEAIKARTDSFMANFFGAPAAVQPAQGQVETASSEAPRGNDEDDSFQKYFKENYTDSQANAGDTGERQWQEMDMDNGEPAAGGSMGASLSSAVRTGAPGRTSKGSAAAVPPAAKGAVASRGVFGGLSTGEERKAAPKLYASLPAKNGSSNTGTDSGGQQPATSRTAGGNGGGYGRPQKGGSVSGMSSQQRAAALDGGSEGMAAGGANMGSAKGIASAASAGGSAPKASGPVASGGAAAGASGGASGGSAGAAGGTTTASASQDASSYSGDTGVSYGSNDATGNDQDLLKTVVAERLNGTDSKFVSMKDATLAPDETLLKADVVAGETGGDKEITEPDPENLSDLDEARTTELKKEMHGFMTRLENKYGKMTDIYRTSCSLTPDVCKAHGVTGSYLTMTTSKGAKLIFGLKYVNTKWRPYTMDFRRPK